MAAIERSSNIQFQLRARETQLQKDLKNFYKVESENPGVCVEDIQHIKTELDKIYQDRYSGAVVRSRSEKFLLGEQLTRRALADEKRYALTKEIYEIDYKGATSSDKNVIEGAFVQYYEHLFGKRQTPKGFSKLNDFVSLMPQLDEDVRIWLEGDITLREVEQAIDTLARQKTPGPGGICAEFYQMFKKDICPYLLSIFHESYEKQQLPRSFSDAHTILIPKSDDSVKRRSVTGYRPITLTIIDYKIFAKVLTRRLQSVISSLIGGIKVAALRGAQSKQTYISREAY